MPIILKAPNSPVFIEFFNIQIRWYGVILTCAIFIGIFLTYRLLKSKNYKKEADFFIDYVPSIIFVSIIGARLFYILGELKYYINNPLEIIMINHGGLSIWGAIIFGLFTVIYYSKKNKLDFMNILDTIAVAMPLCQAIGRWGNYFNQEAYGYPTNFIIKMYIDKNHRLNEYINYDFFHPTFLYESILNLIVFVILHKLFISKKVRKKGTLLFLYLILYSIIRIIVESMRIDSILTFSSVSIVHIICILVIIFSSIFLYKIHNKKEDV